VKENATCCLIIFIRNPEKGKVKSRIAKTTGEDKALEIYQELLNATRDLCTQLNDITKIIYYSSEIIHDDDWDNKVYKKRLQQGSNLGERMSTALKLSLQHFEKAVLIGSDCPYITPQLILKAFETLAANDLVIGPAHDGGYYLIGLKKHHPELFNDLDWGTSKVFGQTMVKAAGVKTGLIEKLSDIDTYEDYLAWKGKDPKK